MIRAYDSDKNVAWELEADGRGDVIQAGNRLYAAGQQQITAIDLPTSTKTAPRVAWTLPVEGSVQRLLAGADRLFAVTLDGQIMSFGAEAVTANPIEDAAKPLPVAEVDRAGGNAAGRRGN